MNELTAFSAMQTDIQVSMDDVVSAFVSQYENNLYARKKELTSDVKVVETKINEFVKALHKKINGKSFATALPFDLKMSVGSGCISWDDAKISFTIAITKNQSNGYGNTINVTKTKSIPAVQVKAHEKLQKEVGSLRADLGEVLVALKSVTRKERQVRGRIAIRKLEDSGYANLMQDEELVKLVQLD